MSKVAGDEFFLLDDVDRCLVLDTKTSSDKIQKQKEPFQLRVRGGSFDDVKLDSAFWDKLKGTPCVAVWLALSFKFPYYGIECTDVLATLPLRALKFGDHNAMGAWQSANPSVSDRVHVMKVIGRCSKLEKLWLNDVAVQRNSRSADEALEIIQALSASLTVIGANLTHFEITGHMGRSFDHATAEALGAGLKALTNVVTLELGFNALTADSLKCLLNGITSTKLVSLNVGYNAFGARGFELLATHEPFCSTVLPRIEKLYARRCNLEWDTKELDLQRDQLAKAPHIVRLIHQAPRLIVLEAGQNFDHKTQWAATQHMIDAVLTHPRAGEWQELDLSFNFECVVPHGQGEVIASLVRSNPGLVKLDMSYVKLDGKDEQMVAAAVCQSKIAYIGMWDGPSRDRVVGHVNNNKAESE